MNDLYTNASLYAEDNLLEPEKEDNYNTKTNQNTTGQLSDYEESPKSNISEISMNFRDLVVKQRKLQSALGALPQSNAQATLTGIEKLVKTSNSTVSSPKVSVSYREENSSETPTNSKRPREQESPTTVPLPKKQKKLMMKPLEDSPEARPVHYLVLLLPDLEDVNLFSEKHERKLKPSVDKAIRIEPNPDVKFEWTGPDRGRYKFVCGNEVAKAWAMAVVPKLTDLWENAKIKAVDMGIIPRIVKASITFNNKAPNMVDLFEGIDVKNPTLDTLHWRVYKQQKVQGNKINAFIGIDQESVKPLKDIGFRPYFEGGRIKITVSEPNNNN